MSPKTVVRGLSKSKGITREPYAPGFYNLEITGGEEKESKSGNTMFVHTMKILEGPEQPSGRNVKGGKFTSYFPITEAEFTVDKLADFVKACGIRVASDDGYDPAKAIGKVVWAQFTMGVGSNGTPQAQASKFYSEEEYASKQTASDD
jgi:hypothetical protein